MICLDNTDVIEGGAATDAVVDYTIHGLVGTTFTQLAAGVLSDTLTAALYTAGAAVSVVSIILVNTHSAAVAVTLRLDPGDGGNPRYIIPKTVSLGVGYSLHTDGARIVVMNASGIIVTGENVSDTAYNEATWNGVTTIAPSKNVVRDEFENKAPKDSPTFTTAVTIPETAAVADHDKFLVSDSGVIKYRTGAEVLSDIGGTGTHRIPIMGAMTLPDATGECYMNNIFTEIPGLGTGLMRNLVMTLKDPSADTGFYGTFQVPQDYVGTPVIVVRGVLDGTVGATSVDFEFSYLALADNESLEAGWVESVQFDTGNTNGWATEDLLIDSTALSANFAVGDEVFYYFKRDFGTDDFNGDFHVIGLYFQYADA